MSITTVTATIEWVLRTYRGKLPASGMDDSVRLTVELYIAIYPICTFSLDQLISTSDL